MILSTKTFLIPAFAELRPITNFGPKTGWKKRFWENHEKCLERVIWTIFVPIFSFVTSQDSLFKLLPSYGRQQRFSTNFWSKMGPKKRFSENRENSLKRVIWTIFVLIFRFLPATRETLLAKDMFDERLFRFGKIQTNSAKIRYFLAFWTPKSQNLQINRVKRRMAM